MKLKKSLIGIIFIALFINPITCSKLQEKNEVIIRKNIIIPDFVPGLYCRIKSNE